MEPENRYDLIVRTNGRFKLHSSYISFGQARTQAFVLLSHFASFGVNVRRKFLIVHRGIAMWSRYLAVRCM